MYQTYTSLFGQQFIVNTSNNIFIPVDPGNTDYQAYLAWVAAGNSAGPYTV